MIRGENTYGGRCVVNPSGGLISKGHPLGATGLAQCAELTWQLRGMAEKRQVAGAKLALQHNIGLGIIFRISEPVLIRYLGGACYVALYQKYNQNKGYTRPDQTSDPAKLEEFERQEQGLQKNPLSANKTSLETFKTGTERVFDMTREYVGQNGLSLCEQVPSSNSISIIISCILGERCHLL